MSLKRKRDVSPSESSTPSKKRKLYASESYSSQDTLPNSQSLYDITTMPDKEASTESISSHDTIISKTESISSIDTHSPINDYHIGFLLPLYLKNNNVESNICIFSLHHMCMEDYTIGRKNNDYNIFDNYISRKHCFISSNPHFKINITSCSNNGTYINNKILKAGDSKEIESGDEIAVIERNKNAKTCRRFFFMEIDLERNNDFKNKKNEYFIKIVKTKKGYNIVIINKKTEENEIIEYKKKKMDFKDFSNILNENLLNIIFEYLYIFNFNHFLSFLKNELKYFVDIDFDCKFQLTRSNAFIF